MENKKKFKLQLPHVYTLAFILIIVFAILTWILPSGQFDRQLIDTAAGEREVARVEMPAPGPPPFCAA